MNMKCQWYKLQKNQYNNGNNYLNNKKKIQHKFKIKIQIQKNWHKIKLILPNYNKIQNPGEEMQF